MAEMAFAFVDGVFVLVHTSNPPSDAEWDAYINDFERRRIPPEDVRTLVFTAGGGPNTSQRAKLNEVLGGKSTRAAVLSSSRMVRGIVTALGWFNKQIRVLPEDGLRDALLHLELTPQQEGNCQQELARLRALLARGGAAKQSSGA